MNLEEITSKVYQEVVDTSSIPNKNEDPEGYEFWEYTLNLIVKDEVKKREKELERLEKEVNRNRGDIKDLVQLETKAISLAIPVGAIHEGLHALSGYLAGADVKGFSTDGLFFYTLVSGNSYQIAFTSLFPHLLAIPGTYYTFFKKKFVASALVAPTLSEFFPLEMFGRYSDFMIAAYSISPHYAVPIKYLLLTAWVGVSSLISKLVYKYNLNKSKNLYEHVQNLRYSL